MNLFTIATFLDFPIYIFGVDLMHLIALQLWTTSTAQKMKFSFTDYFSKCDQILRKLRIWSHLLKKSVMENFIFCAVKFDMSFSNLKETMKAYFWYRHTLV